MNTSCNISWKFGKAIHKNEFLYKFMHWHRILVNLGICKIVEIEKWEMLFQNAICILSFFFPLEYRLLRNSNLIKTAVQFFCDNWIHSKSEVAVCSPGKSRMIRHCLSPRDISSRVYSPLTCCVSVTLAPHSSIQTLSRVYNSNSDGLRLPSFRIASLLSDFSIRE